MPEPVAAALYELPMREIGGQLPTWDELEAIKNYCRERTFTCIWTVRACGRQ